MTDLLLPDVDEELVRRLRERASRHGRPAEEELRAILEEALRVQPMDKAAFLAEAERLLAETRGRTFTDSADMIREDRNRDGAPW